MRRLWLGLALLLAVTPVALAQDQHPVPIQNNLPPRPMPEPSPEASPLPTIALEAEAAPASALAAGNSVKVGDELTLRTAPAGTAGLKLKVPDGIEESGWSVQPLGASGADGVLRFKAVPLKKGKLELKSLAILDSLGAPVAQTAAWSIEAGSVIDPKDPKAQEPAPLRPPLALQFPLWAATLLALGGLALLALAGILVLRAWKRYRARSAIAPAQVAAPALEADERALQALERLAREGLMAQGKHKAHFFRASEILKAYVAERYLFDALESTSSEILERVPSAELKALLEQLDRVKFTDHIPSKVDGGAVTDAIAAFVRRTFLKGSGGAAHAPG